MKIEVTQDDIDNGVRHSTEKCPIALAATRALGGPILVHADGSGDEIDKFIIAFDKGEPVSPFVFDSNTANPYPLESYADVLPSLIGSTR